MTGTLLSRAWLTRGRLMWRYHPGVLRLTDGRLSFTAASAQRYGHGQITRRQLRALEQEVQRPELAEEMHRGEEVQVFDVPLDRVDDVVFPRFFLGLVLNLRIYGTKFRFAFSPPRGLQGSNSGDLENIIDVVDAVDQIVGLGGEIGEMLQGRNAGKAWKATLSIKT